MSEKLMNHYFDCLNIKRLKNFEYWILGLGVVKIYLPIRWSQKPIACPPSVTTGRFPRYSTQSKQ